MNCPVCAKPAVANCKCFLRDSRCENGHTWHTCRVHNVIVVPQHPNHSSTPSKQCTCVQEEKQQFIVVTDLHDTNYGDPSVVLATQTVFSSYYAAAQYVNTIHPSCNPRIIRGDFQHLRFV
jgi:hypothetical protein